MTDEEIVDQLARRPRPSSDGEAAQDRAPS
jgi:hypothetical protein